MDLRVYYRKVREVLETIAGEFVVVVSLETPDGGKPGVTSEASRPVAARLVVDGKARLATADEAAAHQSREDEARAKAQEQLNPNRWPVAILSEADLGALKSATRSGTPGTGSKLTDSRK